MDETLPDLDALFDDMKRVLEAERSAPKKNLSDMEEAVAEVVGLGGVYASRWRTHHAPLCGTKDCEISKLTVVRYESTGHLCAQICRERLCAERSDDLTHSGATTVDDKNYFLCETTGTVHLCGAMCRANKDITNADNEYVCPISGMVMGVEMKGEWWTDPDKQNNDATRADPELDQDAMEMLHPPVVVKHVRQTDGKVKHVTQYAPSEVKIESTPQYHSHPFEKPYTYYLVRCKNILWLLMYSQKRQHVEKNHYESCKANMIKAVDKYMRNCEKQGRVKQYTDICSLVRLHVAKSTSKVWVPPIFTMERALYHYAGIILKFFWLVLERTPYGAGYHTHLPFDYFVLATAYFMKSRGLYKEGKPILHSNTYLSVCLPDPNVLYHFGIKQRYITRIRNAICNAVSGVKPEVLSIEVTKDDALLFMESKRKRDVTPTIR